MEEMKSAASLQPAPPLGFLDRLKTLATTSSSATFTGNRGVLNGEFQTDITEIDRQAQTIGLNTGGTFAQSLGVYMGGGGGTTTG